MGGWPGKVGVYGGCFQRGHAGHAERHDGVDLPRRLLLGDPPATRGLHCYRTGWLKEEVKLCLACMNTKTSERVLVLAAVQGVGTALVVKGRIHCG